MSVWLTEQEFRQSGAEQIGISVNTAFLKEVKDEHVQLRDLFAMNRVRIQHAENPHMVLEWMQELLDQVETYFTMEEFFGYFEHASTQNQSVSRDANRLQKEHGTLFLQLMTLINRIEEAIYDDKVLSFEKISSEFIEFADEFEHHETQEMMLMMKLCNEEFGVGD